MSLTSPQQVGNKSVVMERETFLLRTIVVVIVVMAPFVHCTFKIYSAIRLSSRNCVINSVWHHKTDTADFRPRQLVTDLVRGNWCNGLRPLTDGLDVWTFVRVY